MMDAKKILIAGGGTGGHVLAGVAVADAWKAKWGGQALILFVGAYGGMEEKLVPQAGYSLKLLRLGSLNRVSLKRRIKTYFQLPGSFFFSIWILLSWKPDHVLGVGGYASGPIVLISQLLTQVGLLKARIGILEQNSIPGFTNRVLSRFVNFIFAAFPGTESQFPGKQVFITGNPIRSSMKLMAPAIQNPFTVFIFGGSQGALGINTLILDALPYLNDLKDQLRWIHQTGEKDYDRVHSGYEKQGVNARVEKFIHNMPAAYQQSSLVICRSGSSTLSEVAAVGRASILIPLPTAADHHQEENAKIFANRGASCLVSQSQATGESLAQLIRDLIGDSHRIHQMEKAVTHFYRPHASKDIVEKF